MGIADVFGFGKKQEKEKLPFRTPREVADLRLRIEMEQRENFPNIARYQEIVKEADLVQGLLDELVARKEYAGEALRIKNELTRKMDELTTKVENNLREAKRESGPDYVEKNIDYLARKSSRDQAKTLYTEFLGLHERVLAWCREGKQGSGGWLGTATTELIQVSSSLNSGFFKRYPQDREIQGIQEQALVRVSDLIRVLEENNARLEHNGLGTVARISAQNLAEALKALSAP